MSIDERFAIFAQEHPEVLSRLIELALDAKARGYKRYSLKALWEVLRFSADPMASEKYKLPNELTSRYARLVMEVSPDLAGFFVIKSLKDEGVMNTLTGEDDDLDAELNGY